ncbi:MAG: DUF1801 domain-containing protein [Rhodobacteraceae bacterium]|nr:DUF1801 domain-containing protein [Paracoccaceae bacterium]
MIRPFPSTDIKAAFDVPDKQARKGLLTLRELVFNVANDLPQIGEITEALRWGQPSYLTLQTKSGSTLRLGIPKSGGFALFVHCQTSLISDFHAAFPNDKNVEGKRAVLFKEAADIDPNKVKWLIRRALTYHLKTH